MAQRASCLQRTSWELHLGLNLMTNDTPDYVVIDLETSIKNRGEEAIGDFKASPYHPDNKIVAVGRSTQDIGYAHGYGVARVILLRVKTRWL